MMTQLKNCLVELYSSGKVAYIMFHVEEQEQEELLKLGRGTPMRNATYRMKYEHKGITYYSY